MNSLTRTENQALARTVLELDVNNHPGVMSHVVGLFSRRAYNVEGILVMPVGSGETSRIWLLVNEDERLDQMVKQVEKLEDVLAVRRHGAEHEVFVRLEEFFRTSPGWTVPASLPLSVTSPLTAPALAPGFALPPAWAVANSRALPIAAVRAAASSEPGSTSSRRRDQ
jgi:acetolactate synthase-1/3 small subunit